MFWLNIIKPDCDLLFEVKKIINPTTLLLYIPGWLLISSIKTVSENQAKEADSSEGVEAAEDVWETLCQDMPTTRLTYSTGKKNHGNLMELVGISWNPVESWADPMFMWWTCNFILFTQEEQHSNGRHGTYATGWTNICLTWLAMWGFPVSSYYHWLNIIIHLCFLFLHLSSSDWPRL